jgi:hypothetical protein
VTAQSEQKYITYLDFSNNVCEATDISTAGDSAYAGVGLEGISPYNPPGANAEILHGNNTYINILHSVLTNPWTASTSTNSRIFKTKSVWDQMTKRPAEEGTFTDISTPSTGVDEYRIWVNPVINSKRANIVIIDLDLNGSVSVNPSTLLTNGDSWSLYHYKGATGNPIQAGIYSGTPISINVIEETLLYGVKDTMDYFILQKN